MTSAEHASGSDRIAEVAEHLGWSDDEIVVNLQGDEPLMPAVNIRQVADNLAAHTDASIASLCVTIDDDDERADPAAVKVVRDAQAFALYFSRATIPTGDGDCFRHIGLYAYRLGYLRAFTRLGPCPLEQAERLEQLRALWHGARIHVAEARATPGPGVDTAQDLERVGALMASGQQQ